MPWRCHTRIRSRTSIADLKRKDFWIWWLFGSLLFIVALPAAIITKAELDPMQDSAVTESNQRPVRVKRPIALTILVIIFFVIMVLAVLVPLSSPNATKSDLRWEIFIRAIWIIALFGVWFMRKWGLYLFLYQGMFIYVFSYILKHQSPLTYGLLLNVVFCIVGFLYFKRMR